MMSLSALLGRAMAQAVSRRPLTAAAWVRAQGNPVRFVVDKVALGQVFLRFLRFYPVSIIPPRAPLFRKLKFFLSFIHLPLHSSSSKDGQKVRKSGRKSSESTVCNDGMKMKTETSVSPQIQNTRIVSYLFDAELVGTTHSHRTPLLIG
jgi:hypothetical protein